MNEKLIISGKYIDPSIPHTDIWGISIPLYLFIGGLAAGLLIFASLFYIRGKEKDFPITVKIGTLIPFFIISIGLLFLIEDLRHKLYFWQLMLHFKIQSPMSWGSWVLVVVTILSILWPLSYIDDIRFFFEKNNKRKLAKITTKVQNFVSKYTLFSKPIDFFTKNRKTFAYIILVFAIILGIYTGILMSSFNARPLWNTSILGLVFLTSGISTAAALLMWLSNNEEEKRLYTRIDILVILLELVLIGLMFLGLIWGTEYQQMASKLFLGGPFTASFWGIFVTMGLLLPLTLEIMEYRKIHIPTAVPSFFVLMGGLVFRIILLYACQVCMLNIDIHI